MRADGRDQVADLADETDLERALDERDRAWDAVVLGAAIPDPLAAARRIKARSPDVPILVLAAPGDCARIQHQLLLAPLPGEPVRCVVLDDETGATLSAHVTHARLRRLHQHALRRANEAVAQAPARAMRLPDVVERFADAAPIGILLVEAGARLAYRNRLVRALAPDAAPATVAEALPGVDPALLATLLERPERHPKARLTVQSADGALRAFDATSAPLEVAPGRIVTLVTLDDVTALLAAQQRLEEARTAAARVDKLASMGSLVGGLAHEIRTPLTALLNHAALMEVLVARGRTRGKFDADALDEHLEGIAENVDRMRELVRDLHRFIRGERSERRRVVLSEAVADAVRLLAAASRGTARIDVDLGSRAFVEADPAQLQQVALNLLQNAVDASPSGASVRVATRDARDHVELVVEDEGAGIPDDVRGRIFEPFVTTKPEGTGLGLSIVRRLVELHGGRIHVDTGPTGTRFVVSIPRA